MNIRQISRAYKVCFAQPKTVQRARTMLVIQFLADLSRSKYAPRIRDFAHLACVCGIDAGAVYTPAEIEELISIRKESQRSYSKGK